MVARPLPKIERWKKGWIHVKTDVLSFYIPDVKNLSVRCCLQKTLDNALATLFKNTIGLRISSIFGLIA